MRIFLSYSRADAKHAEQVAATLKQAGAAAEVVSEMEYDLARALPGITHELDRITRTDTRTETSTTEPDEWVLAP